MSNYIFQHFRSVCNYINSCFIQLKIFFVASTLVSKWRGDSEKLVRVLFDVARHYAPSTIFLDEIDSILSSRGGEGQEHEASRRMKTELLMQMDGLRSRGNEQQVFVMAASNLPWDLDVAILRRLEKRVLVPLPEQEAREVMLKQNLIGRTAPTVNFEEVARSTVGYSGADMELLCREAAMRPVRRLMTKLEQISLPPPATQTQVSGIRPSRVSRAVITEPAVNVESLLRSDPVSQDDIMKALETTKRSSDGTMDRYRCPLYISSSFYTLLSCFCTYIQIYIMAVRLWIRISIAIQLIF